MKDIMTNALAGISQDPKVVTTVVVGGAALTTGTILDWLPAVAGIVASSATLLFTLMLAYFHWKKMKREEEKHKVEMAILKTRRATDDEVLRKSC